MCKYTLSLFVIKNISPMKLFQATVVGVGILKSVSKYGFQMFLYFFANDQTNQVFCFLPKLQNQQQANIQPLLGQSCCLFKVELMMKDIPGVSQESEILLTDHPTVVYFQSGGVLENKMDVVKKPNLIHENFTLLLNKASPRYCFVITLLFFKNL